ncbi:PKD domain protein [uncultured archaeon]|nr:PKD domain protein [uncultured archaeon]
MKNKNILLIFLILIFGILINQVVAEISISNESYSIDTSYGPLQKISGWVNISVKEELANLTLSYLNQSITLKEFLDRNGVSYTCFPTDCQLTYIANGTESESRVLTINEGYSKTIGLKLTGQIDSITGFSFNVSTDAASSCIYPLKIDLLDDGLTEWKSDGVSSENCYIEKPYGCFEVNANKNSTPILPKAVYCEKTKVPPVKWFRIGSKVTGSGTTAFKLSIKTSGAEKSCDEPVIANQSGEISCVVQIDDELTKFTDAEICLQTDEDVSTAYNISYEDHSPCGYSQLEPNGPSAHDFEVFVYPRKYSTESNFKLDQDRVGNDIVISTKLSDYISSKYNKNCTPECIIPIKITSGINQRITIDNLKLDYVSQSLSSTKNKFYEVSQTQPKLSFNFKKLDISKANFLTPSDYGQSSISIMLGSKEIVNQNMSIKKVPRIYDILHTTASTLIPTTFIVYMENISSINATIKFDWDFGDGDKQTTNDRTAKHTYSKIGSYDVSVKVIKEGVGESTKSIKINVVPPKEGVGEVLKQYRDDLKNVSYAISSLPEWIKPEIKKKIDIDDLDAKLKIQENNYKEAIGDEYTKVMQDTLTIKIPYDLKVSQKVNTLAYIPNRDQFSVKKLEDAQGETIADSDSEEVVDKYFNSLNNWMSKNLDTTFETKTYGAYYRDGNSEDILSYVTVNLSPKEDIQDLYLIINGNPDKVKLNDESNLKTKQVGEDSTVVTFTEVGAEAKKIEFLYPGKISATALPFFISPDLKEIEIVTDIGKCNNNGVCDSGEDSTNCRQDCKPWGITLFFLIILIIVALTLYIVLQEWYKRRYESYLFKDRNQLFNLINYMDNACRQNQTKIQIFTKLKEYKWTNEQLEFAWRKLKGQRTGMWELPIFKWLENKKVKTELDKRKLGPTVIKPGFGQNPPTRPQPKK